MAIEFGSRVKVNGSHGEISIEGRNQTRRRLIEAFWSKQNEKFSYFHFSFFSFCQYLYIYEEVSKFARTVFAVRKFIKYVTDIRNV